MLEEDRDILYKSYKECKDYKEKIRYQALYAVSRNIEVKEVAVVIDVEESTIYDWIHRWEEERDIKDKPRSGRPEKLTEKDDKDLKDILDNKSPTYFGINAATWTTRELHEYFLKVHHKEVDEETIRQHLHTINAHYVKGQLVYKEADTNAQIDFAKNVYQLTTKDGFKRVVFLDEMSVSTSAHRGYGWTTQERLLITAPQSHT